MKTFHGQIGTISKFHLDNDEEIANLTDDELQHLNSLAELIYRDTKKLIDKRKL